MGDNGEHATNNNNQDELIMEQQRNIEKEVSKSEWPPLFSF